MMEEISTLKLKIYDTERSLSTAQDWVRAAEECLDSGDADGAKKALAASKAILTELCTGKRNGRAA